MRGLLCLFALVFAGCAGYRLGPTNGLPANSRSIQVNLFQNETIEPRLIEAVANSLRRKLQQDGTYALDTRNSGDIIVNGVITQYDRSGLTYDPRDTLTPRDFNITLTAFVTATDRLTGRKILERPVTGRTIIRAGPDLSSAERQAVPLLAEDLARNVTDLLVDGTW